MNTINEASSPSEYARAAMLCFLACIATFAFTNCAHDKDEDGLPPKYTPKPVRDPVEQRVFYDGWGKRN